MISTSIIYSVENKSSRTYFRYRKDATDYLKQYTITDGMRLVKVPIVIDYVKEPNDSNQ